VDGINAPNRSGELFAFSKSQEPSEILQAKTA